MTDQTKEPVAWTSESWLAQTRQGLEGYITGTKRAGFDIPLFTHPQGWQPIETAPKTDHTPFLVLLSGNDTADFVIVQVSHFEGWLYSDAMDGNIDWDDRVLNATHWMQLPAAPDKGSRA